MNLSSRSLKNDREKRQVLRGFRKTVSVVAEVTSGDRHVPGAVSSHRKRSKPFEPSVAVLDANRQNDQRDVPPIKTENNSN